MMPLMCLHDFLCEPSSGMPALKLALPQFNFELPDTVPSMDKMLTCRAAGLEELLQQSRGSFHCKA